MRQILLFTTIVLLLSCHNKLQETTSTTALDTTNLVTVNTELLINVDSWLAEYNVPAAGNGVKTTALFLPKSKRGVIIFTNGGNGVPIIINVIKGALDNGSTNREYMNEGSDFPEIIEISASTLEKYIDTHKNLDGEEIQIYVGNNELIDRYKTT